jgi:hypothetical protein
MGSHRISPSVSIGSACVGCKKMAPEISEAIRSFDVLED